MTRRISEQEWRPAGVDDLEPGAFDVVRGNTNTLVVAGPGAGKTELLAQRASFLLTTNRCPAPRRILAISFKRDAASNLGNRVRERCGDLAGRFDSMTLDAFAKGLVDRFRLGLPENWRPSASYQVRTKGFYVDGARDWMRKARVPDGLRRPRVENWDNAKVLRFFTGIIHGSRLPYDDIDVGRLRREWGRSLWEQVLSAESDKPSLTFPMLNRLAAYLLRCNPTIAEALRSTYAYVFLDEFQDTTEAQWDLILSAFKGASTVMTAVGDDKQRIMRWAGAMSAAFRRFEEEFQAKRIGLVRNYRSAPELVHIQDQIARTLVREDITTEAAGARTDPGVCSIWRFANAESEAEYIAQWIEEQVEQEQRKPHDFCVLARQRVGEIITSLQSSLAKRKLRLRDESTLQDLRVEPLSEIVLYAIRLAVRKRDPEAWTKLLEELSYLVGLDADNEGARLEALAVQHRDVVKKSLDLDGAQLSNVAQRVVDLLGYDLYRAAYPQYVARDYFDEVVEKLQSSLQESFEHTGDVSAAVDDFLGMNVIPAMTIHKSKGLEFDTVIFIGLEDAQWWNFPNQLDEEKRAFFVAFSRAIRRVIFTYSERRPRFGQDVPQTRHNIRGLYDVLQEVGIEVVAPDEGYQQGESID